MIDDIFDRLSLLNPVMLDKTLSETLDKKLCKLEWNEAGTRINWVKQGPHKFIKFGSGTELGNIDRAELSEFKALKHDKIILLFSAYESALLVEKENLLNNWALLDCFFAEKFFFVPYQKMQRIELCSFVECDPLNFIAGHL